MKSKLLVSFAALGLLIGGLIGCNGNKGSSEPSKSSSTPASQSSSQVPSSSQAPSSSSSATPSSSSSAAPAHEHNYSKVGESVKNADQKDVYLMECADKDDKYIGIAFDDYSEKAADFDSAANASKYGEVDSAIWDDARMLAKTKGTTISWKINVDKAITGAKLSLGVTSTYESHGTTDMANQFSVKVNDGQAAAWEVTGTYNDNGLAPSKRTYLMWKTFDLVAGENTILISQESTSNRLLFGGEVRIHYSGDAKPVEAPVPFEGYKVTFKAEHCKVLVFSTKAYDTETPVEATSCIAKDETGAIVPYDVEDLALQPQASFRVVCDEGYSVIKDNITVTPETNFKNLKQNPDSKEGQDDIFRITKIQGDIEVTISPVAGEQAKGYKISFVTLNCDVKVYVGPKNEAGDNLDTPEDGVYYARAKDGTYAISYTTPQVNFEVIPEAGFKFVSGLDEKAEGKVNFIAGEGEDFYNKVVRGEGDNANCYRITKVASDLVINLRCIPEAGEEGLGYEITFVTTNCKVLVYDGQDYRFAPYEPVDNKALSRTDAGEAAKYVAKVDGVDANEDGDYDDDGDTAPVAEVKPQINFLVVCDEGYEFNSGIEDEAKNVSFISGTYNKCKNVGNGIYRITVIKSDLTVTIAATAVAA